MEYLPDRHRPIGGFYEDFVAVGQKNVLTASADIAPGEWASADLTTRDVTSEMHLRLTFEYISDMENYQNHQFTDTNNYENIWVDEEIKSDLYSMDATYDAGYIPINYIAATVGFDAPAGQRLASNTYRDMLR